MSSDSRVCTGCGLSRPLSDFHRNASKVSGFERSCKDCSRNRKWKSRYGISRTEFDSLMLDQDGCCAICGDEPADGSFLHVDHCHDSGLVRGLLCPPCNMAIGLLKDHPAVIKSAASYVESHIAA